MKILLCVDESKHSEAAIEAVASQFRPQSTQVRVLHVLQPLTVAPPPQMSALYAPELEQEGKKGRELVERAAKKLAAAGFQTDTAVEQGDIRMRIIETAADWKADLIVVGSHGHSGIPRLLLGSRAEFVARNAPCSVEIVRAPAGK
ncbi:MAG TPA: universal stress protein [Candidatus Acidoferrales bacterium]|nr:universal stress protein [Candidatus Acidoferrales bacterium]